MTDNSQNTTLFIECRLLSWNHDRDENALAELMKYVSERLEKLCHKRLALKDRIIVKNDYEDLAQEACLKLFNSMQEVHVESARHFLKLASLCLYRAIGDSVRLLKRTDDPHGSTLMNNLAAHSETNEGISLLDWELIHAEIARLPGEVREAFELRWYTNTPFP